MDTAFQPVRSSRPLTLASALFLLFSVAAWLAAMFTKEQAIFSLVPPGTSTPDLDSAQRQDLHFSFFTAWAALVLTTPALCAFPFRHRSEAADDYWRAFWSIGFLAFIVHFYWTVVVLFGADWALIRHTPRVSAAVLDTIVTLWWGIDVVLAWAYRQPSRFITIQRIVVHALVFLLFFMASAKEGELLFSKILGFGMGLCVAGSLLGWYFSRHSFAQRQQ